jgi:hypothetical protein
MAKITAKRLALLLAEELERDSWGDIDPYLFREVAEDDPDRPATTDPDDAKALAEVLERVTTRLELE